MSTLFQLSESPKLIDYKKNASPLQANNGTKSKLSLVVYNILSTKPLNLIFVGGDDINGVELGSIYYFNKIRKIEN